MKTPGIVILALVIATVCQPGLAQIPDVQQLLRDVQARYTSLQSYSATGEVRGGITSDGSSVTLPANQSFETRTVFTIKLARPQMFRIVWEQKSGETNGFSFSSKGAAWSDGEFRNVTVAGQTMQPADTETALAMATGVSGGAAHTIPSIFFDLSVNGITSISKDALLSGGELIDGDDCYVVKAHSGNSDYTYWISKNSKLVIQAMRFSSGVNAPQDEMTDSDARKVLESMGQKVTDEAIRDLRTQLAGAAQSLKSIKSSYSIERHRDIKTNDVMLPSDFREKTGGN
jgi:hypothetical protein